MPITIDEKAARFTLAGPDWQPEPGDSRWISRSPAEEKAWWTILGEIVVEELRGTLGRGLDRHGRKLRPIRYRRPDGALGPPLSPHQETSRSQRLLTFKVGKGRVTVYWSGGWGKIVGYHRAGEWPLVERDIVGLAPAAERRARQRARLRWRFPERFPTGLGPTVPLVIKPKVHVEGPVPPDITLRQFRVAPPEPPKPKPAPKPKPPVVPPAVAVPAFRTYGEVSPAARTQAETVVAALPAPVKAALARHGVTIGVGRRFADVLPDLAGKTPRGYPAGWTWESAAGVYHGPGRIAFANEQVRRPETTEYLGVRDVSKTLRHEVGHAYDEALGNASHAENFRAVYEADVADLSPWLRDALKYYLQPGQAGREETFADAFADLHGGGSHPFVDLARSFPRVAALIRELIGP